MADFARWGCAIARALGSSDEEFLDVYRKNIDAQNNEAIQGHPVATTIVTFLSREEEWEGTPSKLLEKLGEVAEHEGINVKDRSWPKAAHILRRRINEVKTNLADFGIEVINVGRARQRTIRLQKVATVASPPSLGPADPHYQDDATSIATDLASS